MIYTVQSPDGETITMEGPEGATADDLSRQIQNAKAPDEPIPTALSSFGSGVMRQSERMTHGVIDTLKGIRNIVKAPFAEGEYPGFRESQYGPERQAIAEYEQQAQQRMDKDYQTNPLSTMLGQAAYFAPMAGVNTPVQAAMSGAATGLADYGSTPAEDAIGGMLGMKAGDMLGQLLKPMLQKAPQSQATERAIKRGFQQTPAERTGSKGLDKIEMAMESNPFTAGILSKPNLDNQDLLNMQYLQELGVPQIRMGDRITTDAVDTARADVSKAYDNALEGSFIRADKQFQDELTGILNRDLDLPIKSPDVQPIIEGIVKGFDEGFMDGSKYQRFRSSLTQAAKNVYNSPSNAQPGYGPALSDMVSALDNLAARNLPDADMRSINRRYRMLKQGTDGATPPVNVDTGNLSASKMRNKLNKDGIGYKMGRDESPMVDTIHAMNSNPRSAGNSGTAERMFLQNITQGDLMQNLLYGGAKHTLGRAYNSKLNPMGRGGDVPKAFRQAGVPAGIGTDVDQLMDLLLNNREENK